MAPVPKNVQQMGATRQAGDQRGFTLIDLLFVIALIGVLSVMALPGMVRARGAAQASSALGTMRAINSGQLTYAITCGLGFYAPDLPTLGQRPPASSHAFLPEGLTSGAAVNRHGYVFTVAGTPMAGAPATCNGLGPGQSAPGYAIIADPLNATATARYFATNAETIIYEHTVTLNGIMPQTGVPPAGTQIK